MTGQKLLGHYNTAMQVVSVAPTIGRQIQHIATKFATSPERQKPDNSLNYQAF